MRAGAASGEWRERGGHAARRLDDDDRRAPRAADQTAGGHIADETARRGRALVSRAARRPP